MAVTPLRKLYTTYRWAADAVEEENLDSGEDRVDDREVDDAERLDIILLEHALVYQGKLVPSSIHAC